MQDKGFANSNAKGGKLRNASKKSHELGKSWYLSSIYMDLRPSSSSIFVTMSIFFIQKKRSLD
ncbi:hypothetical protein [Nostoc sphaeroides]|uniref:Uncharacterized protein n=1 Tax=Nostoc sphaeroides CCNUC1 TaxID=2653204 RepID=A0A5P8WBM6_9NOSO|nr:hypothetical protein [Nostoc sphaeroides]MCC5632240.1 hypothetical protein [Nostoc sphaeroides CHAB 2801]QFS50187.1 hypothetical protein GXM_07681 [Nostoc sphaeroides CCNUC1]